MIWNLSKFWTGLLLTTSVLTLCTLLYPDQPNDVDLSVYQLGHNAVPVTNLKVTAQASVSTDGDFDQKTPFHQFYKDPPPPPPIQVKALPPIPPVRPATHFPFKYMGQMLDDKGQHTLFLLDDDEPIMLHLNSIYNNTWRVEEGSHADFLFTYLPTHEMFTLNTDDASP